jgi:hypothetical protein
MITHPFRLTALLLALAALHSPVRATLLTVQNAGFETLFLDDNTFNVDSPGPVGWSAYGTINHSNRSTAW